MWEPLVNILVDMLGLYQNLLALGKQKHEVLVKARTSELAELTRQEELLLIQIGKLEVQREHAVSAIVAQLELPAGEVTLASLAAAADSQVGAQLSSLKEQFTTAAEQLAKLNMLNSKLVDQALFYINFNINLLTQNTLGPTYAAQGQEGHTTAMRTVFDRKV